MVALSLDGFLSARAIIGSAIHPKRRAQRPRPAAPVIRRRCVRATATSSASTVPSSRGSPDAAASTKALGRCDSPAPWYRVRRCTGTSADGQRRESAVGPAATAEGRSRSETTVPTRRVAGPLWSVIGWTWTMRVPDDPGATNTAAGPVTLARIRSRSDGRPAQASGVLCAEYTVTDASPLTREARVANSSRLAVRSAVPARAMTSRLAAMFDVVASNSATMVANEVFTPAATRSIPPRSLQPSCRTSHPTPQTPMASCNTANHMSTRRYGGGIRIVVRSPAA